LGAGYFGRLALRLLSGKDREGRFLVVDRDPQALAAARALGVADTDTLEGEAIAYLAAYPGPEFSWDWLIPMVPLHVAADWLIAGPLAEKGWVMATVPPELGQIAVSSVPGPRGELYLSQSGHLCPEDCAEPQRCPVTGEERQPLFQKLAAASRPGRPILVVVSRQLAPGVGGFPPGDLDRLAAAVDQASGPVLVATACRCHGVIHSLVRQGEQRA
jgi:hypothetical protein